MFQKSLSPFISGHDYLIMEYQRDIPVAANAQILTRDFRRFSPEQFSSALIISLTSDSVLLNDGTDVNDRLQNFQLTAIDLLDIHAPLSSRVARRNPVPWFTQELRNKCKERDRLYRRAKRFNNGGLYAQYKILRNKVKQDIRSARDAYIINRCDANSSNCWKILRKFGLAKDKFKSPLHYFSSIELFNYYSSVTSYHPPCSEEMLSEILGMPGGPSEFEFTFRPIENTEVHQMMLKFLRKAKGYSCDGLSLSYFKDLLPTITPFFTNLFNLSIETGTYPNIWKKSVIVPLSKIATPKSTADTLPVANLAHFAKVFDSLMIQQLTDYLETNNILSKFQSGFRKSFSTQTAFIKITEDVRRGVEAKLVTVLLLFDFKRAFDS